MSKAWDDYQRYTERRESYDKRHFIGFRSPPRRASARVSIRVTLANGGVEVYNGVGRDYAMILQRRENYNLNFWADHPNGNRIFRQLKNYEVLNIEIL